MSGGISNNAGSNPPTPNKDRSKVKEKNLGDTLSVSNVDDDIMSC